MFKKILTLNNTLLNKKTILKILENNHYYEEVYKNLYSNFENNILSSGLDTSSITRLINQEQIKIEIIQILNNLYQGQISTINSTNLKNNFHQVIAELTQDKTLSLEEQNNINLLEENLSTIYEEEISYSLTTINKISPIIPLIHHLSKISLLIISLLLLNFFAIILVLLRNKPIFGISLLASGLILIVLKFIIGTRLDHILFINKAFSKSLITIITDIITYHFNIGLILTIIGLIYLTVLVIIQKKTHSKNQV